MIRLVRSVAVAAFVLSLLSVNYSPPPETSPESKKIVLISAQPPAGGRMILERNLRGFDRLCASCGSQDPADTEASMLESQPGPESAMIHW